MGILSDLGPVEDFEESQKQQKKLKIIGIKQFFHRLKLYSKWQKAPGLTHIKWGEEIQWNTLKFNEKKQLELCKEEITEQYKGLDFPVMLEYGSWMMETIPKQPYNTDYNFYEIVHSIRNIYKTFSTKPRIALTIPVIPFLGLRKENQPFNNEVTQSKYVDDSHISNHSRFKTLTKHIRMRRGQTVQINVPVFKDTNTNQEVLSKTEPDPNFIHMDAMAFGMGNCCLQCTFSTKDFDHARYVYDQLNVISPILLAMTAGTPFYKGKVSDWDLRWKIIAGSVDDRTPQQRDENHPDYIPNPRYYEASYYLWNNPRNRTKQYNDFYTGVKQEDIERIRNLAEEQNVEIDEKLAFHLANIFKRDFLIVHRTFITMSTEEYLLFEMLNGTNWNSVRLKIPINDDIGWRVEFRPMEVQLTPDENAAFCLFIHLIVKIMHESTDLNLYIPISKLRENFNRAHKRDAVMTEKFFFRTNIFDEGPPVIEELTVKEIFFGKGDFRGLFAEIEERVEKITKNRGPTKEVIKRIREFFLERVSGTRLTLAKWMRRFVNQHPDYTHNSILSKSVMDDLLIQLHNISLGRATSENFKPIFPYFQNEEADTEDTVYK